MSNIPNLPDRNIDKAESQAEEVQHEQDLTPDELAAEAEDIEEEEQPTSTAWKRLTPRISKTVGRDLPSGALQAGDAISQ